MKLLHIFLCTKYAMHMYEHHNLRKAIYFFKYVLKSYIYMLNIQRALLLKDNTPYQRESIEDISTKSRLSNFPISSSWNTISMIQTHQLPLFEHVENSGGETHASLIIVCGCVKRTKVYTKTYTCIQGNMPAVADIVRH